MESHIILDLKKKKRKISLSQCGGTEGKKKIEKIEINGRRKYVVG